MDFGFKRIGLAIAESEFGIITPKPSIDATGTLRRDAENLSIIFKKEEADRIVLGLPVEEDGNLGKMARVCQTMAENLRGYGIEVEMIDERYSSVEAETALRQEDLKASQRRKLRDGEAAGILLERYLENLEKA
ncbi:MAG: Holliday junction resolvase RuvX [Chlorobia bacterium]|nr:Holliday junction resolvase RuvX [Fimbriimonadaceae bacterium]